MRRGRRISAEEAERILAGHAPDGEFAGLAALIRSTRVAYLEPVSSELETRHLAAITEALAETPPAVSLTERGGSKKMLSLVPKFAAAGLAAVLGMSGLAYAGVPFVPNPVKAVVDVATDGDVDAQQEGDLPEGAQQGKATAEAKREAAERYTDAVRAWTDCVAEMAPQHEATGADGEFDPEAACGPKPKPQDEEFSPLTEPASEAGKAGQELGEQMRREHQPSDAPEEEEDTSGQDDPSGPDHPSGPDNPGPPDGTPGGPPGS